MYDTDFAELIKLAMESLKEKSVYELLQNDVEYQKESDEESVAEQRYNELNLTKHQRMVCRQLLDCRDKQNIDYSNCAYVAGLYDAFRIMAALFPEKWDIAKIRKVLYTK